jgi:hypothetical protein
MTFEGFALIALFCLGFLFTGWLVVTLFARPEVFWRFFDQARDSRSYLRDDNTWQGMVFFLPFLLFLAFGCALCVTGLGFLQSLVQ